MKGDARLKKKALDLAEELFSGPATWADILAAFRDVRSETAERCAILCSELAYHACSAAFCEECDISSAHLDDADAIRAEFGKRRLA